MKTESTMTLGPTAGLGFGLGKKQGCGAGVGAGTVGAVSFGRSRSLLSGGPSAAATTCSTRYICEGFLLVSLADSPSTFSFVIHYDFQVKNNLGFF
jgi:hypothetical protein